jgi:hypothetical protein
MVVTLRRIKLPHRADFVGRVAGDPDVPVAFEDDLDILDIQRIRAPKPRHLACRCCDGIDKFVD